MLDAGNTVPFITRYRKDQTGGLDEEQIRAIESRLIKMRLLAERKQTILRSIDSQGKLTPELAAEIEAAASTKRLEDLYLPYKPKKQTLATVARERGLEPLADEVLAASGTCADLDARAADFVNPDKGLNSAADVLLGVGHILAELISEQADLRQKLRQILKRSGKLVCTRGEGDAKIAQGFRDYFEFNDTIDRVPEHRVLAINRGEKAKALRVKVEADLDAMQALVDEMVCAGPPARRVHSRLWTRRAGAARLSQPRAGSSPRIDRLVRSPRRGSVREKPPQSIAAEAGAQPPRVGHRSGLQERLQTGGPR